MAEIYGNLVWTRNHDSDSEYNERTATLPDGRMLVVFSDRDGTEWVWRIGDDGEPNFGHDTMNEAKDAALAAAKEA